MFWRPDQDCIWAGTFHNHAISPQELPQSQSHLPFPVNIALFRTCCALCAHKTQYFSRSMVSLKHSILSYYYCITYSGVNAENVSMQVYQSGRRRRAASFHLEASCWHFVCFTCSIYIEDNLSEDLCLNYYWKFCASFPVAISTVRFAFVKMQSSVMLKACRPLRPPFRAVCAAHSTRSRSSIGMISFSRI